MRLARGDKVLKPVHPNAGIEAEYRRRLLDLVEDMSDSYAYWLTASYRRNRPEMALDREPGEPARITAAQVKIGAGNKAWAAYVDGAALRNRSTGVIRTFRSRTAAETAGLRSAGWNVVLTEPILVDQRLDKLALATARVTFTPAANLQETLDGLRARWAANFEETAPRLARWFTEQASARSQAGLKKILREGGVSVRFEVTPAIRDVLEATTAENVSLIRSIGQQYHTEVEGMVMRSVQAGRDVGGLTAELEERFGITRRRAAGIALDQNNKATSNVVKVRQSEAGVMAVWLHSHAGKKPRKTHVANSGKLYDPRAGWHDPDPKVNRRIWPGELINCRCVSRSVVRGFS